MVIRVIKFPSETCMFVCCLIWVFGSLAVLHTYTEVRAVIPNAPIIFDRKKNLINTVVTPVVKFLRESYNIRQIFQDDVSQVCMIGLKLTLKLQRQNQNLGLFVMFLGVYESRTCNNKVWWVQKIQSFVLDAIV